MFVSCKVYSASDATAQLVELVLPLAEDIRVTTSVGMVLLTHPARFEYLFVIGFDQHIAELTNLRVREDSSGRLDAIQRYVSKRATQPETPVMIF